MKRKARAPRTARTVNPVKHRTRLVNIAKLSRPRGLLDKTLSLIKTHPGIRPSELNQLLNVGQSDGVRNTLIKRGLIRKEKDGSAMRYYLV